MREQIQKTLEGLKDFQAKTVDYVYEQLYAPDKNRNKMLIADEVGLGKTIVAKGILARIFEAKLDKGLSNKKMEPLNVVYICSNMALASQNIKKLNFLNDESYVNKAINRLIYLAYKPNGDSKPFQIYAITPSVSFEQKSNLGEINERAILFCLLANYAPFENRCNGLKWLLKGKVRDIATWENKISEFWNNRHAYIREDLFKKFRKELFEYTVTQELMPRLSGHIGKHKTISLWDALLKVCEQLNETNYYLFHFQSEIIRTLRHILSKLCLAYLDADIFILDEFQRYSNLIKLNDVPESPAVEIARAVFSLPNSKVLMLSATPFKPYTNDFDESNGEVHYPEFLAVLKFLMQDKSDDFWKQYEYDRKAMFGFLRHPDKLENQMDNALKLKDTLEGFYREGIVRTEKLLVSDDRNALIKTNNDPLPIKIEDIKDFVALDRITLFLNRNHNTSLPIPLEYVKSCPFALSFLDNYQHKIKLKQYFSKDSELDKLLKETKHAWVNLKDINEYKPLIPSRSSSPPNAKLRLLLTETVHNNGWKYLWIPPSIPYYKPQGAFKDSCGYSKTLIFSSWKLVPRMVASLVSYEAERLSVGNPKSISESEKRARKSDRNFYFEKKRSPRPQFTFKVLKEEQEPQQMNNFILSYPCLYLANLYDPVRNVVDKKKLEEIKESLKKQLVALFDNLKLNEYVSGEGDWQKWYWLAPLLLDKASEHTLVMTEWFFRGITSSELSMDTESENQDNEESQGRKIHFEQAKSVYINQGLIKAGKLNEEQIEKICEHLAELTLGSPAICYLRSQRRHKALSKELLDAAFHVSSAFLTMFNKPESIAVVRLHTEEYNYYSERPSYYWERALRYMIDGNIQAMLDEFIYLLINGENIQSISELSNFIADVLSVRTATSDIDDYSTFSEKPTKAKPKKRAIRAHYAVDFGTQKVNTAQGAGRQINIRQAFNSPFRPFVLASTSIGQEGLDFHLYCKKIFHWNLPSNPIDFEQREGRINRYQGLVIRLNLANKYCHSINPNDSSKNIWEEMFYHAAMQERNKAKFPCDLIPFWHTETLDDIKIERFVPQYPFSRDIERFKNIIKVLTFYRLTFGQPRQEELVEALHDAGVTNEAIQQLDNLIINLSPIKFL